MADVEKDELSYRESLHREMMAENSPNQLVENQSSNTVATEKQKKTSGPFTINQALKKFSVTMKNTFKKLYRETREQHSDLSSDGLSDDEQKEEDNKSIKNPIEEEKTISNHSACQTIQHGSELLSENRESLTSLESKPVKPRSVAGDSNTNKSSSTINT